MRALVVSMLALALVIPLRATSMARAIEAERYEHVYYLPSSEVLSAASLGHREALADLVWLRALVYIGDEFIHGGHLDDVHRYADTILDLDPDFRRVYRWAATMGLYRPTAPTMEEAEASVAYLHRGVERFPDDGGLAWELASAYLYELPSLARHDPELRASLRQRGTEYMVTAAEMGAGPTWIALTNASQLEALGRMDQAVRHLEEMYALVQDPAAREQIALRLEVMREGARAEALRTADAELRARHADDFPWVPVDFYVVLGERRVPRTSR